MLPDSSETPAQRPSWSRQRERLGILSLTLILLFVTLFDFLLMNTRVSRAFQPSDLPPVMATGAADYRAEPHPTPLQPLTQGIIESILRDEAAPGADLSSRIATLAVELHNPIPSATGAGLSSSTASPTATFTAAPSPFATATFATETVAREATAASTVAASATATQVPVFSPTPGPIVAPSSTPTRTPRPRRTPTLTATATNNSTATASATPTVTATPTPNVTRTPPSTFTPTPSPTSTATSKATTNPTPASTQTPSATGSPAATLTPITTPTNTPAQTGTPTPSPSSPPTRSPTATDPPTSTPTSTATEALTETPIPSKTPAVTPTLAQCNPVATGDLLLAASEDTYIAGDGGNPDLNFGSANPLSIRPDHASDRRGLVKFSIPVFPPKFQVTRAILYVYQENPRPNEFIEFHQITSNWSEDTVTWNSTVNFDSMVFGSLPTAGAGNCMRAVYLPPSLVEGWINGSIPNNGILLMATGNNGDIKITSREETANPERRPQLSIQYQTSR